MRCSEDDDEDEKEFRRLTAKHSNHPPARQAEPKRRYRRRKHPDLFVKVPVWWLERVATLDTTSTSKTLLVGVWLFYLSLKNNRRRTFSVSNVGAKIFGISPRAKRKALHQLKAAGLILVERRPRRNPIVTLIVV
jgi:hypothetical protein